MSSKQITAQNAFSTHTPVGLSEAELDAKYPNRPHNHGRPLAFHGLIYELFQPLNDNKKPVGPPLARRKQGPHGAHNVSPHEQRRLIIEKFIARWRREVGNDIHPAFRLILPDKDRERAMYGLKEKAIGKLLIRIIKIDKNSEDGFLLMNFKNPGQRPGITTAAGDFAARCREVLAKRPLRTKPGDMDVEEVNYLLDKLSLAQKEEGQLPIFETFYKRMNADELMYLIRIILRQMKVGATEKTFFDIWHPDADLLYNVSSNLRRVCWELHDPTLRLEAEETDVNLMQCFQPQLAQFQMHSFEKMVQKMRFTDDDKEFWIEEKLDGERMQMHMAEDSSEPGGIKFAFWSRKAKDYTYLYGSSLDDDSSALTRHLKDAFHSGVRSIILDGEMITWDTVLDKIVGFGTLKTAALEAKVNAETEVRPVYRVFDILYLNGRVLTKYTMRDRRRALEGAVQPVYRRLEVQPYSVATKAAEIEPKLRVVVAEASEGLVLKNPRSMYRLNDRNDDWMKVKPEYMSEYGEDLDCVVIGGYWGSGRRGGTISSLLCGLRVDENHIKNGADPAKCWSFFKVGGGFAKTDYQSIKEAIGDKWEIYDKSNPPLKYIELGGGMKQREAPDVWIRSDQSIVISVKGASIHTTEEFRTGLTLRFPRFKRLRLDRSWDSALSIRGFYELKSKVEEEQEQKQFTIDESRRKKRKTNNTKKEITVAGMVSEREMMKALEATAVDEKDPTKQLFEGLTFYVLTECMEPKKLKRSKADVEAFVKAHGGKITQKMPAEGSEAGKSTIPLSDRAVVKAHTIMKKGEGLHSIIRPRWVFECVAQAKLDAAYYSNGQAPRYLLPYEPKHCLFVAKKDQKKVGESVDEWGDGFAKDIFDIDEMKELLAGVDVIKTENEEKRPAIDGFLEQLEERGSSDSTLLKGWMFKSCNAWFDNGKSLAKDNAVDIDGEQKHSEDRHFDSEIQLARNVLHFAGGTAVPNLNDRLITHVVLSPNATTERKKEIRHYLAYAHDRKKLPRVVTTFWVHKSWEEATLLDEERFPASS